jgi:iron complex outermembrane receptor protein
LERDACGVNIFAPPTQFDITTEKEAPRAGGMNMSGTTARCAIAAAIALTTVSTPTWAQGLEEIIVTAQKREQGLQDVPISVEAFTKQRIDSLSAQDISDLGVFTPNVDIGRGVNQPTYRIRGIGTSDFGVGADPAVGVYVDGVYIGRSGGSKTAFNDIARVEILNGPQGTLFGRNAAAGAIQYVTNKPVENTEGWVKATVGDYDRTQLEGVYNMALSDTVFWRTGALWNQRDGYIDNNSGGSDINKEDNWSITTSFLWVPTDRLDLLWRLEYDESDGDARAASSAVYGPRDNGAAFKKVENDHHFDETRDLFGTSLHLTFEMDLGTFTSITAYREYETENPEEKDGSAELLYDFTDYNSENNDQWSQEFRFDGDVGDSIRYVVGANYNKENAKQTSGIDLSTQAVDKLVVESEVGIPYDSVPPGFGFDVAFAVGFPDLPRIYANGQEALAAGRYSEYINVDGDYESWAVFGDMTWTVIEDVDLTLGIRYTDDSKDFGRNVKYNDFGMWFAFDETRIDDNGNLAAYPEGTQGWYRQKESWDDTTGRALIDWRVTDEVMLYASYAQGYKAGGFNSASANNDDPPFDPEEIDTYELGVKSTWFDNTLRVNAAYYDYTYDNLQELAFVEGACQGTDFGSNQFLTSDITGKGYELSINWLATEGLDIWANAGQIDADVDNRTRCEVIDGNPVNRDESGDTFNDTFNYALGATYTYGFNNGSEVALAVAWAWEEGNSWRKSCTYVETLADGTGAVYGLSEVDGNLIISQPSATGTLTEAPYNSCPDLDDREQLNARLTYLSPDGAWELAAWVTNATDWDPVGGEDDPGGLGGELRSAFSDGSPAYDRREPPRMYGVELKYTFD